MHIYVSVHKCEVTAYDLATEMILLSQKRIIEEIEKAETRGVIELDIGININHEREIGLMQDMKVRNWRC